MEATERIEGLKEALDFLEDMEFLGIRGLEEILVCLHDIEGGE